MYFAAVYSNIRKIRLKQKKTEELFWGMFKNFYRSKYC